ncbi:MAG TPA: SMP-30/gluconolactonase/LRE family protein [Acetobacteraceae bacterium]|nr:SMP-30/gluconolactonase/LRE family protein [Acetobacteraceae bacterium]
MSNTLTRRGVTAGVATLMPMVAMGQETRPKLPTPPSVVTEPPRQWGRRAPPAIYPDPDVLAIDPSFKQYQVGLAAIHRLWTGFRWAEGPAWSGEGKYALFSDVKGNTQYRYIWETGEVTPFRSPSWNSNGNTFDFQGRQVSCQDFFRRVVRWEPSGAMTIIADSFEGKPLNSPNDVVPHPDGSIWFTDPPYGDQLTEGHPDVAGGRANPRGIDDPTLGNRGVGLVGGMKQESPENTYRWDPSGRLDVVVPGSQVPDPNGICFSPDYKTLYLISTGPGPGDNGQGGKGVIYAFDVQGTKLANMRLFTDCMVDGVHCGPDGMRADRAGNLWVGSNAPLGYCGVTVWNSAGKLIGRIRLPEVCANLCFAGRKRDYLFMAASQSIYMLLVNVQGAAPG